MLIRGTQGSRNPQNSRNGRQQAGRENEQAVQNPQAAGETAGERIQKTAEQQAAEQFQRHLQVDRMAEQ